MDHVQDTGKGQPVLHDVWAKCYDEGWQGVLPASAMAHPAKFSRSLIARIYQHVLAEGWLRPGDICLDPFAGVGCGALDAALAGVQWVGCELEPRFIALAQGADCPGDIDKHAACAEPGEHGPHYILGTLELWQRKYGTLPQWVPPILVQGNSRRLQTVLQEAGCCVTSPPYTGNDKADYLLSPDGKTRVRDVKRGKPQGHGSFRGSETYGRTEGQLGSLHTGTVEAALHQAGICVSSPPYSTSKVRGSVDLARIPIGTRWQQGERVRDDGSEHGYGSSPDNLGNLPPGTCEAALSITSPPYANGCTHTGGADPAPEHVQGGAVHHVAYGTSAGNLGNMAPRLAITSPPYADQQVGTGATGRTGWRGYTDHGGGTSATDGQLAAMPTGPAVCVTSPPYEHSVHHGNGIDPTKLTGNPPGPHSQHNAEGYGYEASQLGNTEGTTFWEAARDVLQQLHAVLRDGAHAVFVVKSYVREGKIVDFPGDWRRLCEAVGFETLHEHHAMLVEAPTAPGLFGEEVAYYKTQRKSFFRRLSEAKGAPAIDFEVVYCMRKRHEEAP